MSRVDRERYANQPPPLQRHYRGPRVKPLIPVDESSLGPAMRELTPGMRAFVAAKIHFGASNAEAARLAGYSDRSPNALEVKASQVAHDPRVQAALLEEGRKLMRAQGPASIRTLVEIRDNAEEAAKDRLKAAVELLNRSGFHAVSEHHDHQHLHMSEADKDARILALAAELGLGPAEAQKMLISPTDMQRNAQGVYEMAREPPRELSEKQQRYGQAENETRRRRRRMTPEEREADKARSRAELAEQRRREYAAHQAGDDANPLAGLDDLL